MAENAKLVSDTNHIRMVRPHCQTVNRPSGLRRGGGGLRPRHTWTGREATIGGQNEDRQGKCAAMPMARQHERPKLSGVATFSPGGSAFAIRANPLTHVT